MEYRALGPLEVLDGSGHKLPLGGVRQQTVLASLLLRAGQTVVLERQTDESIAAPKGRGPPGLYGFSLQTGCLQGTAGRDRDRHRGPQTSRRCGGGRGPCPLVAVLPVFAEEERQTSPLLPPKGTDPGPCGLFPCKTAVFRGPQEGAMIAIVDP